MTIGNGLFSWMCGGKLDSMLRWICSVIWEKWIWMYLFIADWLLNSYLHQLQYLAYDLIFIVCTDMDPNQSFRPYGFG
jgi:hypothetical protein